MLHQCMYIFCWSMPYLWHYRIHPIRYSAKCIPQEYMPSSLESRVSSKNVKSDKTDMTNRRKTFINYFVSQWKLEKLTKVQDVEKFKKSDKSKKWCMGLVALEYETRFTKKMQGTTKNMKNHANGKNYKKNDAKHKYLHLPQNRKNSEQISGNPKKSRQTTKHTEFIHHRGVCRLKPEISTRSDGKILGTHDKH